jgi:hypothetical protein
MLLVRESMDLKFQLLFLGLMLKIRRDEEFYAFLLLIDGANGSVENLIF